VQDTMEKYEMFPKFMDSATYTKFVAAYMVSEREDLTRIGYIKAKYACVTSARLRGRGPR
jgi:hypothetical protein